MNPTQRQKLKALAHSLKPVVLIGSKGLTPAVVEETDHALTAHELIKVKIASIDKEEREAICDALASQTGALRVQLIGKTLVLYRERTDH